MQVAFIVVVDALGSWKPEKGSFISWYNLRLKSAFTEATGQRTQRDKRDPLQNCVSLDMPITDNEGGALTLGDTLPDPAAEQAIENVAETDYLQRLHDALSQALQDLSESQRRTVVLRICYGLTLEEASERLGAPQEEIMANERMGLRLLRHPSIARSLKPYL